MPIRLYVASQSLVVCLVSLVAVFFLLLLFFAFYFLFFAFFSEGQGRILKSGLVVQLESGLRHASSCEGGRGKVRVRVGCVCSGTTPCT